jgi:hypothetical protein
MKSIITLILLIFNLITCTSQNKEFKNQGEQEDYWAERIFNNEYVKKEYSKFNGKIEIINDNKILFDNKTLLVNCPKTYLAIFKNGLFYPQLIFGNSENNKILSNEELNKLSQNDRFFYNINRNDSFSISNFEELEFLSKSPKIKRFRFWNFRHGSANPQVYFIELINENANSNTSLENFLKNAHLTYIKAGHIVI